MSEFKRWLNRVQDAVMDKKMQMEAEMMSNTRIVLKRIMLSPSIRQAIEKAPDHTYPNSRINPASAVDSWLKSVRAALALKDRRMELQDRLSALFRAVWSGAKREAGAWPVFRSEYGSDDPITWDVDKSASSYQMQSFADHYQRRV